MTTLYKFSGGADGGWPVLSFQGNDGNLYGVTGTGGTSTNCEGGCGTVFMFSLVGAPCSYTLSATNATFASAGGSGSVSVSASNGCAWTATSNVGFITITSDRSGSGNGTVYYSVAANTNSTEQVGTMTIAGQTFTVNQAGAKACGYTLSTTRINLPAAGGSGSVGITASDSCSWTAASNNGFITITSGSSGSGNGTVEYTVAPNTSSIGLTGTVTIAGQTFTVTQSASASVPVVYSVLSEDTFALSGVGHASSASSQTCTFTSTGSFTGTFDLYDGTYHYTGTYTLVKNGKQMALTLDANGLSAVESNEVDLIEDAAADAGVSLEDLTVTIQSIKLGNISMENGVPHKETNTITGKASAAVNGKFKTKSFTHKSVKTNWTLVSGGNP